MCDLFHDVFCGVCKILQLIGGHVVTETPVNRYMETGSERFSEGRLKYKVRLLGIGTLFYSI